jgi:hypothetical protein
MALNLSKQCPHGVIGAADEEACVDIRKAGRLALECDVRFRGLEIGEQTYRGQVDKADIHIGPGQNLSVVGFKGIADQGQFSSDAAEKLGTEEVAGAGFLDEGGMDFEAFGHGGSEDFFVKNPMGRGVAAEEVHPGDYSRGRIPTVCDSVRGWRGKSMNQGKNQPIALR